MTSQRAKQRMQPLKSGSVDLPPVDVEGAIALLKQWAEAEGEEAEEQRQTFEALKNGLDEHRPPGYKLFE